MSRCCGVEEPPVDGDNLQERWQVPSAFLPLGTLLQNRGLFCRQYHHVLLYFFVCANQMRTRHSGEIVTNRKWILTFHLSGVYEEIASSFSSPTKTNGDFKITVTTYLPLFCKVQSPFMAYDRHWDSVITPPSPFRPQSPTSKVMNLPSASPMQSSPHNLPWRSRGGVLFL